MNKLISTYLFTAILAIFAQSANSGGWEASTLDTSFIYNPGNYAEIGSAQITYDITANIQGQTDQKKMAKNQTRTAIAAKFKYGGFDVGLSSYMAGAIQLAGQAAHATGCPGTPTNCSGVPSADVTLNSLTLLSRYKLNNNMSLLGGINRYAIAGTGTVTTLGGHYEVTGDQIVPIVGLAYEIEEIAMRVDLVIEPNTDINNFSAKTSANSSTATAAVTGESMKIPQTTTLNFQSGVSSNTLVYGTIRQGSWTDAQIAIPVSAANGSAAITSSFSNKTSYSIGVAQRFSDQLSSTLSYKTEAGSGSSSADFFTLSNGSNTYSLGVRYTMGNATLSAGYSYTTLGDVTITGTGASTGLTATYANNTISAFGAKLGITF